ncbi:hypothetical protein DFH08DRAFT_978752 [Mycena albidolilacea]|uniref:Uncharacterized protein n=1 Tax=Mycena albidolilacea TaxID=1033008 RepID=A0AAD7E7S9_9AGAR|nr:hypothetical protein DFH08DRAFT_978752 [Mycena albidolilacea]
MSSNTGRGRFTGVADTILEVVGILAALPFLLLTPLIVIVVPMPILCPPPSTSAAPLTADDRRDRPTPRARAPFRLSLRPTHPSIQPVPYPSLLTGRKYTRAPQGWPGGPPGFVLPPAATPAPAPWPGQFSRQSRAQRGERWAAGGGGVGATNSRAPALQGGVETLLIPGYWVCHCTSPPSRARPPRALEWRGGAGAAP